MSTKPVLRMSRKPPFVGVGADGIGSASWLLSSRPNCFASGCFGSPVKEKVRSVGSYERGGGMRVGSSGLEWVEVRSCSCDFFEEGEVEEEEEDLLFFLHPPPTGTFLREPP